MKRENHIYDCTPENACEKSYWQKQNRCGTNVSYIFVGKTRIKVEDDCGKTPTIPACDFSYHRRTSRGGAPTPRYFKPKRK